MRLALALLALAAGTNAAKAELQVCNASGVKRSLAIGYSDSGTWTSEGWWNIEPGACATPIKDPLKQRYIYWRATTAGQDFADDNVTFCVSDEPFTITGDTDCEARGYQTAGFRMVDTGETGTAFLLEIPVMDPAPAPQSAPAEKTAEQPKQPNVATPLLQTALPAPVPASGDAFERGQTGEPFSQTALFQSCEMPEGDHWCTLYAEGWRYVAYAGQTPDEILTALGGLAVNTPVTITGDLVQYGDITAEVNLSRIEPGPPDPNAALRLALQGDWVSTDDPSYTATILGSEITELSAGEVTSTSVLTIGSSCVDGTELDGDVLSLSMMGGDPMDSRCWSLDQVTPDSLTVFNLPRGNILSFRRP